MEPTTETEKISLCCPRFNPTIWDGKTVAFKDKSFINFRRFGVAGFIPCGCPTQNTVYLSH